MVHMPVIPALGRLRQEDPEFEASPGLHSETLSHNNNKRLVFAQYFAVCKSFYIEY
jgi:hypothetical protein